MPDRTCSIDGCTKRTKALGLCAPHYGRLRRHGDPLGGRTEPGAPLAFLRAASIGSTDECILWPFGTAGGGYGVLWVDGRNTYAHRHVLDLAGVAPADPSMEVAHAPGICHNPACVNPRHLRWATRVENHADKLIDGTHRRGERNTGAKLTNATADAIRNDPRGHTAVAREKGVSPSTIGRIRRMQSYT